MPKMLPKLKPLFLLLFLLMAVNTVHAQKQVYIPEGWENDPALQNWSWDRSYQSANFVIFWGTKVTQDPTVEPNADLRFDPRAIADTLQVSYDKYINEVGYISDDPSTNLGKYKIIVVMNNTWENGGPTGFAFGGQYDGVIGAMWVHPNATRDGGALSHELAHTFQNMNWIQANQDGGGFINFEPAGFFWETHANFMRIQVYPHLAGSDSPRWLATDMFHWSTTRHHYAAFRLLIYMQDLYGIEIVNRLWNESNPQEHPLMTYKRLKGLTQSGLNDFIHEYAKREVTYDYKVNNYGNIIRREKQKLKNNNPHYLWREYTLLDKVRGGAKGRYIVPDELAPQDYGINIIPLYPEDKSREIRIKFKGHTEVNSTAGWRYGFVTENKDGTTANYGPTYSAEEKVISYKMKENESRLYLVVTGAPTEHTSYVWEPGWPKIKRYPYEVAIQNALPEGYQNSYRKFYKDQFTGSPHPNGGGFVAATAQVDPNAYVGPDALVLGTSRISSNARIEDRAWVENATIWGNVVIKDNANIYEGKYSDNAVISGSAICNHCTVSGDARIRDSALLFGSELDGSAIVGGDAEGINGCSSGVYLQTPHPNNGRQNCDGEGANHQANQDINNKIIPFSDEQMKLGGTDNANPVTSDLWLLNQNTPNPFSRSTEIKFNIPKAIKSASLRVFSLLGKEVDTIFVNKSYSPGTHSVQWIPQNMSSGIYIYLLNLGEKRLSKKMVYIK